MTKRISQRFLIYVLIIAFVAVVATLLGDDSIGIDYQIRDQETASAAVIKLHDNRDGTKSPVVWAVIVTPTPTATGDSNAYAYAYAAVKRPLVSSAPCYARA